MWTSIVVEVGIMNSVRVQRIFIVSESLSLKTLHCYGLRLISEKFYHLRKNCM